MILHLAKVPSSFKDRGRDFAPAGVLLSGVPESKQRTPPRCPRPSASLRATCAVNFLRLCGKTHCAPLALRSNSCRKFDDNAVALFGATASPNNLPSQAWSQRAIPNSFFVSFDSCYRNQPFDLKPISSQLSQGVRICPSGCACGTRFRLRALAPKSANASCSDLPPLV